MLQNNNTTWRPRSVLIIHAQFRKTIENANMNRHGTENPSIDTCENKTARSGMDIPRSHGKQEESLSITFVNRGSFHGSKLKGFQSRIRFMPDAGGRISLLHKRCG